jgi:hypothetical protein
VKDKGWAFFLHFKRGLGRVFFFGRGRGEKRVEGYFSIPKGCFLGDMGRWEVWLFWEDGPKKRSFKIC